MRIVNFIIKQLVKISPLHFIIASIAEIGWDVAVEEKGEDVLEGLVIGTEEYVERHIPDEDKRE